MPDSKIDLIIKFIMQNHGNLSSAKKDKYFSFLSKDEIDKISKIIQNIMMAHHA